MDQLYTTHDIARMLQVDPSSVSKWIDKGLVTAFRTPGGHRRVRSTDLRGFLAKHQMPVPEELGSGSRIVVVDDDKPVLDAVKRALKPHSAQLDVVTTTSGIEAILMVSEQHPLGLLIDLNMPDLDGLEVCRRIRSHKALDGVKIVTMTSRHSKEVEDQSTKAGAVACLAKPVDPERLLALLGIRK